MDLNQLFYHHQIAAMRADKTIVLPDSANHFTSVHQYAKRIREYREAAGLPVYSWPDGNGEAVAVPEPVKEQTND